MKSSRKMKMSTTAVRFRSERMRGTEGLRGDSSRTLLSHRGVAVLTFRPITRRQRSILANTRAPVPPRPSPCSHSLAYYGAVPQQTKTPPTTTAAAADWQTPTFAHSHSHSHARCNMASKPQEVCPLAHPPLTESSCRIRLRGGGKYRVPYASTLWT